ncbi:MAG: ParB/RepB/Spo0J family partition protein [Alistipes ihumii]
MAPNPKQPRTHFGEQALDELASRSARSASFSRLPRKEADGRYTIISGERRWRASKLAGLTSMPAYIREADEESMLAMAIVENIQRQDLNAIEVALSLQRLVDECHLTQDSLGERVGKKRSTVANYLRLLKLPVEVQLAVREELISMGHARALINLESEQQQIALLKKTIKKGLSVRQVEEAVKELNSAKPRKARSRRRIFPKATRGWWSTSKGFLRRKSASRKTIKEAERSLSDSVPDDDIETFIGKLEWYREIEHISTGSSLSRTVAFARIGASVDLTPEPKPRRNATKSSTEFVPGSSYPTAHRPQKPTR